MTKEELNIFIELFKKFTADCKRVGKIIYKVFWEVTPDYEFVAECDKWNISDTTAYGTGQDRDGDLFCEFPLEYLIMSDYELTKMVNKMNSDYLEEKRKKEKEEEQKRIEANRKRELSELKRLKEKYENNRN